MPSMQAEKTPPCLKPPQIPIRLSLDVKTSSKKKPSNDLLLFPKGPLHGQMDSLTIRSMRSWLMDLGLSEGGFGKRIEKIW